MDPTDVTYFDTPELFRAWLQAHHAGRDVLWVGYLKKATGRPSMTWEESVGEALCFGWIDSTARALDADRSKLYFRQRKVGSNWSGVSKRRVEVLEAAGLMTDAGRVPNAGEDPAAAGLP